MFGDSVGSSQFCRNKSLKNGETNCDTAMWLQPVSGACALTSAAVILWTVTVEGSLAPDVLKV